MKPIISQEQLDRVAAPLSQAWTLPPAAYTDPLVFEQETAEIFRQEWTCVARLEQVPAVGDFMCADLFGQPIVIVRNAEREVKVMSSVCLHRAMPVAEGSGNATRFVCPYHHWTYELDGRLRSAPMMQDVDGFIASDHQLPELKTEVWLGFVFVSLNPNAEPVAPQLEGLSEKLAAHNFAGKEIVETIEFDSPWNWKILVENFMEAQ
ncbi:MAG: aromatic ring-hydroxylating oxygenase subunit alpha, partial [Pseudomonadales bacterium]